LSKIYPMYVQKAEKSSALKKKPIRLFAG